MQLLWLLLVAQLGRDSLPPPRGYVNDFAGVLDAASVSHMEAVIAEVRAKSRGEIAVVTLPDIGDRAASDVALQIGRQWGVGAKGEAGDPAKNVGVVVLLVPQKHHRPGTGQVFIATGRGAEGFLPDARVGRIRDAMTPYLAREDYGAGLAVGVDLIALEFAGEFGFILTGPPPPPPGAADRLPIPPGLLIALVVFLIVVSRGRLPWWLLGFAVAVREWVRGGHPAPLILTEREWRSSADAFPIEYEDMRDAHRLLAGRDPWQGITVQREHVRRQLEHELMGKLVRLRQAYAALRGDPKQLAQVLVRSAAGFFTMLRAALRLAGKQPPAPPDTLVREAGAVIGFSPDGLAPLVGHALGARQLKLASGDPLPAAYLAAVARTAEFVNGIR